MCYNSFMKKDLDNIIQNIQNFENINIDFFKVYNSKAEYIEFTRYSRFILVFDATRFNTTA